MILYHVAQRNKRFIIIGTEYHGDVIVRQFWARLPDGKLTGPYQTRAEARQKMRAPLKEMSK